MLPYQAAQMCHGFRGAPGSGAQRFPRFDVSGQGGEELAQGMVPVLVWVWLVRSALLLGAAFVGHASAISIVSNTGL